MFSVLQTVAVVLVLAVAAQAQNDTMMVVDANNTMTDNSTSSNAPMMPMTTMVPMVDSDVNDTTTTTPDAVPDSTTTTTTMETTTEDVVIISTTQVPCNNSVGRLGEIYDFTKSSDFTDLLSQNEQILIYEVLAAAEGCKMSSFINAETAERIFRVLGSLPVRHVYILLHYMTVALENEGVVIPT